ncbi:LOW QUALITY PROTEIN: potassium channel subfamily K member 17-like [Pholidichthys leucotaenia]
MAIKELLKTAQVPSILLIGVIYVVYVLLGGVIFWTMEGSLGKKDVSQLLMKKRKLLEMYPCLNQEGLETIAQVVHDASKVGLSLKTNTTTDGFWKFSSSAVFAATVVTTIGHYGNMSPSTSSGQIFCVFFAVLVFPAHCWVLNRVGKYMLATERKICGLPGWGRQNESGCGLVLYFIVPMLIFQQHEGWTYSEAIYYCFITLSTIGFGFVADNNPDKNYPDWYSFIMGIVDLFDMAWLALVINHSIDILEQINTFVRQRVCCKKVEEESDNVESTIPETRLEDEDEITKPPIT